MRSALIIITIAIISASVNAQVAGLPLLDISPSAYDLSLSETTVANSRGSSSIYSNPAMLIQGEYSTLDLNYTNWIAESNNIFGGLNLIKGNRAAAISFYTSGITGLEQRNSPGPSNGDFSIQYLAISAGYAYDFNILKAGISGHYLNEEIYPYRARGYAFNFGLARSFMAERITAGVSLQNIGEMENLDQEATDLPSKLTVGLAGSLLEYRHPKNQNLPIKVHAAADFVYPINQDLTPRNGDFNSAEAYFNVGLSLLVAETIQVNAGYKTGDIARPFSLGLGFITEKVIFNYANIPFNTGYGTVHSIGIQYQL